MKEVMATRVGLVTKASGSLENAARGPGLGGGVRNADASLAQRLAVKADGVCDRVGTPGRWGGLQQVSTCM